MRHIIIQDYEMSIAREKTSSNQKDYEMSIAKEKTSSNQKDYEMSIENFL